MTFRRNISERKPCFPTSKFTNEGIYYGCYRCIDYNRSRLCDTKLVEQSSPFSILTSDKALSPHPGDRVTRRAKNVGGRFAICILRFRSRHGSSTRCHGRLSCVPLDMPIVLNTSLLATLPTHCEQIRIRAEGLAHFPAKGAALVRPTNKRPR